MLTGTRICLYLLLLSPMSSPSFNAGQGSAPRYINFPRSLLSIYILSQALGLGGLSDKQDYLLIKHPNFSHSSGKYTTSQGTTNNHGFMNTYKSTDASEPINAQMQNPSHTARITQFPCDLFTGSTVHVPTGLPHQPFVFQGTGNVGDLTGVGSQFGSK